VPELLLLLLLRRRRRRSDSRADFVDGTDGEADDARVGIASVQGRLSYREIGVVCRICRGTACKLRAAAAWREGVDHEPLIVASGHLFYLAHGNLGNFQTGQKAELRQRYKSAPNYPPASAASPRYLTIVDSMTLQD